MKTQYPSSTTDTGLSLCENCRTLNLNTNYCEYCDAPLISTKKSSSSQDSSTFPTLLIPSNVFFSLLYAPPRTILFNAQNGKPALSVVSEARNISPLFAFFWAITAGTTLMLLLNDGLHSQMDQISSIRFKTLLSVLCFVLPILLTLHFLQNLWSFKICRIGTKQKDFFYLVKPNRIKGHLLREHFELKYNHRIIANIVRNNIRKLLFCQNIKGSLLFTMQQEYGATGVIHSLIYSISQEIVNILPLEMLQSYLEGKEKTFVSIRDHNDIVIALLEMSNPNILQILQQDLSADEYACCLGLILLWTQAK